MASRVQDYAIFLLDPRGQVISWNAGAQRIKQYTEGEILNRHFSVFYTAEDRARKWPDKELERATTEGRFEDEGWRVRKDGSRFWANVVITALRDDRGRLLAFSKITRDLTERRKHEEEMRQSEERFRLLVEGVQDYAIYMLNPEGLVTSWNLGAHRIKGYDGSEIIGQHFSRFFSNEDIESGKPWSELAIARETGRVEDEGWRVRKDGSKFWARVVVTTLYDAEGRLHGFAKVTQDLTQQRHTAALELAARRINDFVAVLAHELRNPLAPIRNAATLLERLDVGDPRFEMLRGAIDRQSAQLSRIVDDLLDISRITRGTLEVRKEKTGLADVVSRAIEAARPAIDQAGHVLHTDLPPHPTYVDGDPLRLTQVLTNLLNNAARYTDPGGRIDMRITTERKERGGEVVITVTDTGHGIEPELLGTIFGMFVQGRNMLHRPGSGLGVGLALARSIVEQHHGTIEARSEGLGKGAQFVVRLPLLEPPAAVDVPATVVRRSAPLRRVLVVDDNIDAAAMLAALLRQLGHEVHVVHDGASALSAAEGFRPDVILLDVAMPGMNGVEVARRLRERKRSPEPLIVAVTGFGKADDAVGTREAGFDMHLVKPVETAELTKVMSAALMH
jgi:PAS domain S-box-containing protein